MLKDIENEVDNGILELVNTINKVDDLITMNSCQGTLIKGEEQEHCPKTYVDFYVLNHNYNLANNIFVDLVSQLGSMVNCSAEFESDFDFIDDDFIEENGRINMRYSLEFMDIHGYTMTADEIYKKAIEIISKYTKNV